MSLENLGLTEEVKNLIGWHEDADFVLARVITEHKDRYSIQTGSGTITAEITGNLRYAAKNKADLPLVGDWVKVVLTDENAGIIIKILPRISELRRQAVGKFGEAQPIAANIDYAFIVQAVGQDFNLNRLERYLTISHAARINPLILLTKTDLIGPSEIDSVVGKIKKRIKDVPVIPMSIKSTGSLKAFNALLEPFRTYCFIGSSGVGKSSIINALSNTTDLKTRPVSSSSNKGRHTTTHRELIILPNGSLVIDTPGMREIGMVHEPEGVDMTFEEIIERSANCRFGDCKHESEKDCAVLLAVENGELSMETLENYKKLKREQAHFSSSVKAKKDKDRQFGKMYKAIIKERKRNKY